MREVFVSLHEQGLVYRDEYITNWCPRCHTALADLEVEHHDVKGALHYVKYPLTDGSGYLTVATTRPETMLGDTAVAVNPEDERFKGFIGKEVRLPLTDRVLPVIADEHVDPAFGTGALKITPAHDPNDFEIGLRHNLPSVKAFDEEGRMNENAGPYQGLDRFEARKRVIADLEAAGLLEKVEDYNHSVGHCYRCSTMIEPLQSLQWFVDVKPLAREGHRGGQNRQDQDHPPHLGEGLLRVDGEHPAWCVSRQIWWGHRIPAWYCDACGKVIVAREDPERCECGGELRQETDVLDTWFSSGLWPFSTLGWPENTDYLKAFYPTACLVTGFDILFFWVARMMMLGLWFKDEIPFSDVYIHALVRAEDGRKMSKSLGNVIDPLEVMDQYGTDAFRFTLAAFAAQGRDVKLSMKRIEGYRNFINKDLELGPVRAHEPGRRTGSGPGQGPLPGRPLDPEPAQATTAQARETLDGYKLRPHRLGPLPVHVARVLRLVYRAGQSRPSTAARARRPGRGPLDRAHRAEKLTQAAPPHHPLCDRGDLVAPARGPGPDHAGDYPKPGGEWEDKEAEAALELIQNVIVGIRNIRGEFNLPPTKPVKTVIFCPDQATVELLTANQFGHQDWPGWRRRRFPCPARGPARRAAAVAGAVEVFIPLPD